MAREKKARQKRTSVLMLDHKPVGRPWGDEFQAEIIVRVCQDKHTGRGHEPTFPGDYEPGGELRDLIFCAQVKDTATLHEQSWIQRFGALPSVYDFAPLELAEAERIAKLLREVRKAYDKNVERFGYPKTFGQFVAFHGDALGVEGILKRSQYSDTGWSFERDVAHTIDYLVYDLAIQCRKAAGKDDRLPSGEEEDRLRAQVRQQEQIVEQPVHEPVEAPE
jgi:hypothetical protein